jgi:hypothetical protein
MKPALLAAPLLIGLVAFQPIAGVWIGLEVDVERVDLLSLAITNQARELGGIQLGVINSARTVRGVDWPPIPVRPALD